MNIQTPAQVAAARTARLVREGAHKPRVAYVTHTPSEAERRANLINRASAIAVTEDFCHICGRPTDHFGEHTVEQILAWAKKPGMLQSLLEG